MYNKSVNICAQSLLLSAVTTHWMDVSLGSGPLYPGGYSGFKVTGRCEWRQKLKPKKIPRPKKIPS